MIDKQIALVVALLVAVLLVLSALALVAGLTPPWER